MSNGIISTLAGDGVPGFQGDNSLAVSARLHLPSGLAVSSNGDIYISDTLNHRIRKIEKSSGLMTTIAGTNQAGFSGDGGFATEAQLNEPHGLAIDIAGNIYIADTFNHRIRVINGKTKLMSTLIESTYLSYPYDVTVDRRGDLYIADTLHHQIKRFGQ